MKSIQVIEWAGESGLEAVIIIVGSFDMRRRAEFNEAFRLIPDQVTRVVVDLEKTTYIDSAAVCMLLGLRMYATLHNLELILKNCNLLVRPLLQRACVDSLFNFEQSDSFLRQK